jgi:hypothetical protein
MFGKDRWANLQKLFANFGTRYYGDGGTIHSSTHHIDIETYQGEVVGVWFRCQALPFKQIKVSGERSVQMSLLYDEQKSELHGVEIKDIK